jgi:hypothetical protein
VVGRPPRDRPGPGAGVARLRSPVRHRAHHPLLEAGPALDPASAPHARAGRPVHLGGGSGLQPASPRPWARQRPAVALGAAAGARAADTYAGSPPISCGSGGGGLACQCAEIPWPLPGTPQGEPAWSRAAPSSRQSPCSTSPSIQQDQTIGLKAKLSQPCPTGWWAHVSRKGEQRRPGSGSGHAPQALNWRGENRPERLFWVVCGHTSWLLSNGPAAGRADVKGPSPRPFRHGGILHGSTS